MKKTKFIARLEDTKGCCLGKILYIRFKGEHRGGWDVCARSREAHRFDTAEAAEARIKKTAIYRLATDEGYKLRIIRALPEEALTS